MNSGSKQTKRQKELEKIAIQREKDLTIERARESTKAFSDNLAFRKKLRGMFSLLSGGYAGFPAGGSAGTASGSGNIVRTISTLGGVAGTKTGRTVPTASSSGGSAL